MQSSSCRAAARGSPLLTSQLLLESRRLSSSLVSIRSPHPSFTPSGLECSIFVVTDGVQWSVEVHTSSRDTKLRRILDLMSPSFAIIISPAATRDMAGHDAALLSLPCSVVLGLVFSPHFR